VLRVQRAYRDQLERKVLLERKVYKELLEHKVYKALRVHKVYKEFRAQLVL
jgi:hypothetical protein